MTRTADAVVIGAGIVGAACADALSRDGLRVVALDADGVGTGATAAGMGHVVVMDDSEEQFALTRWSRQLWIDLAPSLPPEAEYEPRGTLWVAADDEEMSAVRGKDVFYRDRGVRASVLDAAALAEAEPNLRRPLAGALLIPDDSVIYAPCAAAWLIDQARRRGTAVRVGARATQVRRGRVTLADSTYIDAGVVVAATGASAAALFPDLAVRPRKGHLAITDRYAGFVRHQLVELGYLKSAHGHSNESVAFNVQPRKTGQLLIGSSRQYGVTHSTIDPPILGRMLARAIEYMPGLARLSVIRTWTGFRAATEDKLPVVGPCPGLDGVYLATGHEGLGITTSLATGRLIADRIAGRTPPIDPAPYLPSRMAAHV